MQRPESTLAQRFAWCLYDFGNSAFPTVIVTAVYVLYFQDVVVGGDDPGRKDRLWGLTVSAAALIVFAAAPFLGALADRRGLTRQLLWAHSWVCAAATALLAATGPGTVALAVALVVVSVYAFDAGCVLYNAFLPRLVPPHEMPRLSGRAWAFGYAGGLLCLLAVLGMLALGAAVRHVPLLVAAWFFAFTLPALMLLRERASGIDVADVSGNVARRLRRVGDHPVLVRFLTALFFYMNGVNTVYVFAAAFASKSLGFTRTESIVLIMVLNVVAAPGALLFARLAERTSARAAIALSLWLWLGAVAGAVLAAWPGLLGEARRVLFWGVAAVASLCIGATQATSRTFVGQLAPPGMSGEFFGFMAFAGRASAVLGPLVFGLVSDAAGGDQRWAVGSIGLFFAAGLVLLQRVPAPGAHTTREAA